MYWWRRYIHLMEEEAKKPEEAAKKDSPIKQAKNSRFGGKPANDNLYHGYNYEDPDKKAFKMTENLKVL